MPNKDHAVFTSSAPCIQIKTDR